MHQEMKRAYITYLSRCVNERRRKALEEVLVGRTRYLRLVLDGIENVGDASAVIRSCECFGVQDLLMIQNRSIRPYHGVSLGATKWIDIHTIKDTETFYRELKQQGVHVAVYTKDPSAIPIAALPLDRPIALVLGSPHGPSAATRAAAESWVRLPTVGFTDDFNLSVNAALCLASLAGRLRQTQIPWQLSADEQLDVAVRWWIKMARRVVEYTRHFIEEQGLSQAEFDAMLPAEVSKSIWRKRSAQPKE